MVPLLSTVVGFVMSELGAYIWHRWISHAGLLSSVTNDAFRRRHFHHHAQQYPPSRIHSGAEYVASCDVTFGLVDVILLCIAAGLAVVLPLTAVISGIVGIAFHGWIAAKVHQLCHISDQAVKNFWLLRVVLLRRAFAYLRRFHAAHHRTPGNFSLMIPLLDVLGGTLIRRDEVVCVEPAELFPRFQPELSSTCGQPFLRRQ